MINSMTWMMYDKYDLHNKLNREQLIEEIERCYDHMKEADNLECDLECNFSNKIDELTDKCEFWKKRGVILSEVSRRLREVLRYSDDV